MGKKILETEKKNRKQTRKKIYVKKSWIKIIKQKGNEEKSGKRKIENGRKPL